MSRLISAVVAVATLSTLFGCVNPTDLPSMGSRTGYQRAIDQDVSATRDSDGATVRGESPTARMNWQ